MAIDGRRRGCCSFRAAHVVRPVTRLVTDGETFSEWAPAPRPRARSGSNIPANIASANPRTVSITSHRNSGSSLGCRQAVDQSYLPATFLPVDGEEHLRVGWRMIDRIVEDHVVRAEVADADDVPIDRQVHLHVGRMSPVSRKVAWFKRLPFRPAHL